MNKTYGYCRISRPTQNIDRQIRNIKEVYDNAIILTEAYTGTKVYGRKQFEILLKKVNAGDTIVFDSVSRMSRAADEGVKIYFNLYEKGVNLVFLKEPHINTDVYKESQSQSINMTGNEIADCYIEATNKVLMILAKRQIELAFDQAEKEVTDLHERTSEGMKTAKMNGKQIGQKQGNTLNIKKKEPIKKIIRKYNKDFAGDLKDSDTISVINGTTYTDENGNKKTYHISNNTYYKYKKELAEELQTQEYTN